MSAAGGAAGAGEAGVAATTYMAQSSAGDGAGAGAGAGSSAGAGGGASAAGKPSPADKVVYAASDKNKDVILGVLSPRLARVKERPVRVLEIASGTGQHAVHMCKALSYVEWTPTDLDPKLLRSIRAYAVDVSNCGEPVRVDCCDTLWPVQPKGSPPRYHALLNVNMLHVSPPKLVDALFRGAADVIRPGGLVFIYGPFKVDGEPTTPSNATFDASLRRRNPDWGLRDVDELRTAASGYGFELEEKLDVPSNNFVLVFRKSSAGAGATTSPANAAVA